MLERESNSLQQNFHYGIIVMTTIENEILDELMQCPSEYLVELDHDYEYEDAHEKDLHNEKSTTPSKKDSNVSDLQNNKRNNS